MSIIDLSFIVPMYNAAGSIGDTLSSIFREMASGALEAELFVIDDGSKDDSALVVEKLFRAQLEQHPDWHLRLIRKPNGGVSSARNSGIAEASGRYIWFVDSDDLIVNGALSTLAIALEGGEFPDALCFDYTIDTQYASGAKVNVARYDMTRQDDGFTVLRRFGGKLWAWNAVFKRDVVKGSHFKNYPNGEDTLWGYQVLVKIGSFAYLKDRLYVYRENAGASGHWSERFLRSVMQVAYEVADLLIHAPHADWYKSLVVRSVAGMTNNGAMFVTRGLGRRGYELWLEEARKVYLDSGIVRGLRRIVYRMVFAMGRPALVELFFFMPVVWKGRIVNLRKRIMR